MTEAVNYAFEARDYDRAATLIETHAVGFFTQGQMPLLQDWLGRIPAHIASERYRIPMYFCWALFHMRRPVEAASAACRAEEIVKRRVRRGQLSGPELSEVEAELKVLKIGVAITSDDVERARTLCLRFLATEPVRNDYKTGAMYNMLGYACYALSEFDQAKEAFVSARHCHDLADCPYGMVVADCLMGMNEAAMGRLHMAHALFLQAENIACKDRVPRSPGVAYSRLYRGCILYEWNRIDEAKDLLERNIDLMVECGQAEAPIFGLCTYARILHKDGDSDRAWQQLERARNICRDDQLYRLSILTDYEAVCFLLREDKLAQAIARAGLAAISVSELPEDIHIDRWDRALCVKLLIKIRLLMALGEYGHGIKLLDHVLALAHDVLRTRRVMECLILKSIALWHNRERDKARRLFVQALDMGRAEGYLRLFLNEGDIIGQLLQAVITHQKSATEDQGYLNQLVAGLENTARISARRNSKVGNYLLLEELSQRELDVLSLLAAGESNAQISRQLEIKQNTVKWHVKNIFEKLGVNNRTSAVLAAQELKLVV